MPRASKTKGMTPAEKLKARTYLAGAIMASIADQERAKGNLPHQMLGENMGREAVRLADFGVIELEKTYLRDQEQAANG